MSEENIPFSEKLKARMDFSAEEAKTKALSETTERQHREKKFQAEKLLRLRKEQLRPAILEQLTVDAKGFAELVKEYGASPHQQLVLGIDNVVKAKKGLFFKSDIGETTMRETLVWVLSAKSTQKYHSNGYNGPINYSVSNVQCAIYHQITTGIAVDAEGHLLAYKAESGDLLPSSVYAVKGTLYLDDTAGIESLLPINEIDPNIEKIEEQPLILELRDRLSYIATSAIRFKHIKI